ncbi:hypothetical protein EPA93_43620 [Ktedonosporobacter rubrisoli]|uniref:Uncharacterized protein n=1 Tax=Ktedonosporobacter rubrisoli TaxID=2509675 RepID=A0A4P6K2W6_KTERU|nr:hypothetical protein [Ktedonosporobacter rubrisoli]QBD82499.1 hypothetical protein EPA93_43620 [Ktedonosporobacter rubrisoli]
MSAALLICAILVFSLIFWIGLYLISRDPANMRLWAASLGPLCYALGIGCAITNNFIPAMGICLQLCLVLTFLALLWTGLTFYLLPYGRSLRSQTAIANKRALTILAVALPLAMLAIALLLLHPGWLPLMAIQLPGGCILLVAGIALSILDAQEKGEALLPDLFRSFDYSCFTALLFGGQVALIMLLSTGVTAAMLILLMMVIVSSIFVQTFSDHLITFVDKIAFANFPWLQKARAELRTTANTLQRVQELDLDNLDEAEFIRFTRRALSQFGDLARLATNPLTRLSLVETCLLKHGNKDDALERAIELKAILAASIERLKPREQGDFGTSDEWRYYNVLYFPYIAGLKPYSRRAQNVQHDTTAKAALEWFRTYVPERTFYNWQNAATRLIAQDLKARKS